MDDENMDDAEYGRSSPEELAQDNWRKERLLLSYLTSNEEAWALCSHILDPEYFARENQAGVRYLLSHAEKYKVLPSLEMVEAETGMTLDRHDDAKDPRRFAWVADEVEGFCRTRAVVNAVYSSVDKINKGEFGDLVDTIKKAVSVSLHRDLGTDYFHDPIARLRKLLDNDNISTGFKNLDDRLFGGVARGTLSITLAGSGVGKSLLLANLALNHMEQGLNVLYVTHELSEGLVARRTDSMVTSIGYRDVLKRMEEVADLVRLKRKKSGALQIKYMGAGTCCRDIGAYIREYMIRTGKKPDVLVVDYLDLLVPNVKVKDLGNLWVVGKYCAEELRALCGEFNVIGYTASQMTRGAMDEEDHKQSHVAGGISKINTVDNAWSMYQSIDMKEAGLYQIQLLKTRSSSGVGHRVLLKVDNNTLRITDAPEDAQLQRRTPTVSQVVDEQGGSQQAPVRPLGSNTERLQRLKQRINRT